VTLSRCRREDGVAVVVFERPSTPPVGLAATAVPRDYIKKRVFCDLDRLLNFLSGGSDGAYYFPVQVLHELFFMIYIESSWKTYGGGICFYIVD